MAFRIGQQVLIVKGKQAGRIATVQSRLVPTPCHTASAHVMGLCFCEHGNPAVHILNIPCDMQLSGIIYKIAAPPGWLVPLLPDGKEAEEMKRELSVFWAKARLERGLRS